jgi:hypothetical protein
MFQTSVDKSCTAPHLTPPPCRYCFTHGVYRGAGTDLILSRFMDLGHAGVGLALGEEEEHDAGGWAGGWRAATPTVTLVAWCANLSSCSFCDRGIEQACRRRALHSLKPPPPAPHP